MKIYQPIAGLCLAAVLSACGGGGGGTTPTVVAPIAITPAPVADAGVPQTVWASALVQLDGSASSDSAGKPLTYAWSLSVPLKSLTSLSDSTIKNPTFTPDLAGDYIATLRVHNGQTLSTAVTVTKTANAPTGVFSSLTPDCGGASCGAVNSALYSGPGVGVWKYQNTSASAATVNVNITGVKAGNIATMVFSNGSEAPAALPSYGALASPVMPAPVDFISASPIKNSAVQSQVDAHAQMSQRNHDIAASLIRNRANATIASVGLAAVAAPSILPTPAVGATKTWNESYGTVVPYSTTVSTICPSSNNRKIVWWMDPAIVSSGKFTASTWQTALDSMTSSYCGPTGGMARIAGLLGDAWGTSKYADLISETAGSLQDINIVMLNVPVGTGWAGYFYSLNNYLKTSPSPGAQNSNEALAFFINANQVKSNLPYAISTLLHETTHMVNFYQRAVANKVQHDIWLEEASAMMTEDIVGPVVNKGYNSTFAQRLPIYQGSGGNVSLNDWTKLLVSNTYAIGGGFGAFLNRRYGLTIYQGLVKPACASVSYSCLDGLIKSNGGTGFSDEFARFGATVFGQLPVTGAPAGYGYPAKVDVAYTLQSGDLSGTTLPVATNLTSFLATSHTYNREVIASGKKTYVRNNMVVPANTTVTLIIK